MRKMQLGDVFEITTKGGVGYLQYVKETTMVGLEVIRILPGVFSENQKVDLDELVQQREVFFVQFPLRHAVKQNYVKAVGNYPIPEEVTLPKYYRDKHVVKGKFVSWHIVDAGTLDIRAVKELSEEEKHLSPAGIWNDTLLAERIAQGWRPEDWD